MTNEQLPQRPPSDDLQAGEIDLGAHLPTYKFKVWYNSIGGSDEHITVEAESEDHSKQLAYKQVNDIRYIIRSVKGAIVK